MHKRLLLIMLSLVLVLGTAATAMSHGEETAIVPEKLVVSAGDELKVTVEGLEDAKVAVFTLKGMFGDIDIGSFPIDSDDFSQVIMIPEKIEPGSYSLVVTGGENSAKVILTIK